MAVKTKRKQSRPTQYSAYISHISPECLAVLLAYLAMIEPGGHNHPTIKCDKMLTRLFKAIVRVHNRYGDMLSRAIARGDKKETRRLFHIYYDVEKIGDDTLRKYYTENRTN